MTDAISDNEIEARLAQAMRRDQFRLRRLWRNVRQDRGGTREQEFQRQLATSLQIRESRRQRKLNAQLDSGLPIFEHAEAIQQLMRSHQVLVLSGETGSGKSTQLPLLALQLGIGEGGWIGHTQPRRLAARSVANRLAQQLGTPLGTDVGFKIRFSDQTKPETRIKLMTDGILLAETQSDRFLDQYEMLIVDEAHERSLNIDLLLGFLKNLLPKRPDLKVVITSATIDTERFAEHFSDSGGQPAPIYHVPGRTFPVTIEYVPIEESDAAGTGTHSAIVQQCLELAQRRDGDILVFLPTEMDIRNVTKKLRGASSRTSYDLLPLYARLSPAQQNEIFKPSPRGKIVLATNVAESSITVPGIRYVVDTGTARISRYAARSKVQRLPVEPISQASANQRAGRCGRVAPGICVRLYSEADFQSRPPFTTPEIRRTNLAGTILRLLTLGFGDIERFPFLDPPNTESIRDGYKTLFELGAVDDARRLTPLGRRLSRLPVDPRIGRMLHEADANGCVAEMLIIASALELQDPRVRPAEKQAAADAAHQAWNDPDSDFVAILNLWDFIHQLKRDLSRSKFRMALEQNFLSYNLVLQWQDIHRQLLHLATDHGLPTTSRKNDRDAIHRSLLAGLLSSIAMLDGPHEYLGAGGIKFHLWPGSGVFQSKPKWIVAAEVIETTRRYGRTIARIDPQWIFPLAKHLIKHRYVDPFWSAKNQTAMAYQHSSLYGLPIRTQQRVPLANVDPETSRQLFIDRGLVEGELRHPFDFYVHNQLFLEDLVNLANKTRQRQWVIDSYLLAQFYQERLPAEAVDVRRLQAAIQADPELDARLRLTHRDLGLDSDTGETLAALPDRVEIGSIQVPVNYRFLPGDERDGATIQLPREALGHLDEAQLGWLIPGLLRERIVALIRSLPKPLRRSLVPAPDVARRVVESLRYGEGNFVDAVARELSRIAGEPIQASQFNQEKVDRHLLVNVEVQDEQGQVTARGRSLAEIRAELGPVDQSERSLIVDDQRWNQSGLTTWSWGDLPREIEIQRGLTRLAVFPALIDEGQTVGLRVVDALAQADRMTRQGLLRLLSLEHRKLLRSQVKWLPGLEQAKVPLARWIKPDRLTEWLGHLILRTALIDGQPLPRSESDYQQRLQEATERISIATQEVATWLPKLAAAAHDVALGMEKTGSQAPETRADIKRQLQQLFAEETLQETEWRWLQHYPRYLRAAAYRMEKLSAQPGGADRKAMTLIQTQWDRYEQREQLLRQQGWADPELVLFRWMIEEYRVSLFAQQLGTSLTVSEPRLEKQLKKVRQL